MGTITDALNNKEPITLMGARQDVVEQHQVDDGKNYKRDGLYKIRTWTCDGISKC
ncbi:MAG: hypothetical protein ACLVCH_11565 [Roseburia inulinivorans]